MFVEALSMVLSQLGYGDLAPVDPQMKELKDSTGIKALANENRPREKFHALGAGELNNPKLLAILLFTGS